MLYFANPTSDACRHAMLAGDLGMIVTPAQGNTLPGDHVTWCADNGAFSKRYTDEAFIRMLDRFRPWQATCRFAVAPDEVADHGRTLRLFWRWLPHLRQQGWPVAFVAQDGCLPDTVPWEHVDAVFLGGTDGFKLGPVARHIVGEANSREVWAHMGRVNSRARLRLAHHWGCDSADGTLLTFGPDIHLPRLLSWLREIATQPPLPTMEPRP